MRVTIDGTLQRGDWSISFDMMRIETGVTAITGPNGAGKTSLLRLIAGLEAIDSGHVLYDDTPVDAPAESIFVQCRERPIAMVFQDSRLFPAMRVIDNVAFPMRRRGIDRREARERANDILADVGMSDASQSHPADLSGGQHQRVAIARALATDARLLLLDEPLASIDEASRAAIRHLFTHSRFDSVIWVTHNESDADSAARVISLPNSPA